MKTKIITQEFIDDVRKLLGKTELPATDENAAKLIEVIIYLENAQHVTQSHPITMVPVGIMKLK